MHLTDRQTETDRQINLTVFPLRYSKKAFFSASILSALASRDEKAVVGSPREGVANSKEEEAEGGGMLREARPLDWCATDTTPWFKVKNIKPPLYTPAAGTQCNKLLRHVTRLSPVVDCLQFANMEGEGWGSLLTYATSDSENIQ